LNEEKCVKKLSYSIICFLSFSISSLAQVPETFDIATFKAPKGWNKQAGQSSLQLSTEDKASGPYCLITLFKSIPGTDDSKANFDAAWDTVVKGAVNVSTAPQMVNPTADDGWEAQSGVAAFEKDGTKGIAMLVTISGYGKMVNVLVLTNTDAYQQTISDFLGSATLKKPPIEPVKAIQTPKAALLVPVSASGYAFTTTNFDDGWTGTVQEDWVQVTKGTTKVLIHYPNKIADAYNSVLLDGLKNGWDVLVAPRYSSASNFQFRPVTGWQSLEFAEADLVEKGTGKKVYVVLFKMNYSNGSGKYMEFITPNKQSFEQEFGAYHQDTSGWEKMEKMADYNKFGVAAADLKGKGTNSYSGMIQNANIYTGASAGADTHASAQNYLFGPGNAYKWDIGVASGFVGNIKFQSAKSSGRFTVPTVWQIAFSDIEGKPRTYNASFTCVKGGIMLWIDGTAFVKVSG